MFIEVITEYPDKVTDALKHIVRERKEKGQVAVDEEKYSKISQRCNLIVGSLGSDKLMSSIPEDKGASTAVVSKLKPPTKNNATSQKKYKQQA